MWNWFRKTKVKVDEPQDPASLGDVQVTNVLEDDLRFKKEYTSRLTDTVTATITMSEYSWSSTRSASGVLTQPDGRWILFNPENVADKILDPAIIPAVESYSKKVLEMDKELTRKKPVEFIDKKKQIWRRVAETESLHS